MSKTHEALVADWQENAKDQDDENYRFLRSLIVVTEKDVPRIARHLNMAVEEFVAAYLERDVEDGGYRIKTTPCPFLGADNLCTIYDVRPEKCRGYPFTDKPDFVSMTMTHANNAVVCPAVFYLVEQMKRRIGRR